MRGKNACQQGTLGGARAGWEGSGWHKSMGTVGPVRLSLLSVSPRRGHKLARGSPELLSQQTCLACRGVGCVTVGVGSR
jgi:hypothetical protein